MTAPASIHPAVAPRGRPATAGLRERILDAAMGIFARHEYHEVLMDDVARESGVAKGTLYRYFPSKRALYLGVMFDGIDRLHEALREAVAGIGEPVGKLARLVYTLLDHFWDRRFFFALIHRNEYRPDDLDGREWGRGPPGSRASSSNCWKTRLPAGSCARLTHASRQRCCSACCAA
jgi:AcrR family transcriptional regulator